MSGDIRASNAASDADRELWETVPECGACGSPTWNTVQKVCGKRFGECATCGAVRLVDRVAENRLGLLYGDYYPAPDPSPAEMDVQLQNPTFSYRSARLNRVVPPERRRIFEVGCGDGNFLAYLRRAGWAVEGSEFDPRTVEMVRRRHGISLYTGDLVDAPAGPWPVIGAYHVLEHVYHPSAWLREVRRRLEPEGILHLQVPNYGSLSRRVSGVAWAGVVFPQHAYYYTPATLANLLRREGFEPVQSTTWDPWHGPGVLATSAKNVVRRAVTGRIPWTDALSEPADGARPPMQAGRPRLAGRIVDALSRPLSRAEAALGLGAVVDVLARVTPR
jgi:SAM-dependent methyltransferase